MIRRKKIQVKPKLFPAKAPDRAGQPEPAPAVEHVEPLKPVEPVAPVEQVTPLEPVELVTPLEPVELVAPPEHVEHVTPRQTVEPLEPATSSITEQLPQPTPTTECRPEAKEPDSDASDDAANLEQVSTETRPSADSLPPVEAAQDEPVVPPVLAQLDNASRLRPTEEDAPNQQEAASTNEDTRRDQPTDLAVDGPAAVAVSSPAEQTSTNIDVLIASPPSPGAMTPELFADDFVEVPATSATSTGTSSSHAASGGFTEVPTVEEAYNLVEQPTFDESTGQLPQDGGDYISLQPALASADPFFGVAQLPMRSLSDPHSLDHLATPSITPFKEHASCSLQNELDRQRLSNMIMLEIQLDQFSQQELQADADGTAPLAEGPIDLNPPIESIDLNEPIEPTASCSVQDGESTVAAPEQPIQETGVSAQLSNNNIDENNNVDGLATTGAKGGRKKQAAAADDDGATDAAAADSGKPKRRAKKSMKAAEAAENPDAADVEEADRGGAGPRKRKPKSKKSQVDGAAGAGDDPDSAAQAKTAKPRRKKAKADAVDGSDPAAATDKPVKPRKPRKPKSTAGDAADTAQADGEADQPAAKKKRVYKKRPPTEPTADGEPADQPRRKRYKKWNKNEVVDKTRLTMFDLISYNPPPPAAATADPAESAAEESVETSEPASTAENQTEDTQPAVSTSTETNADAAQAANPESPAEPGPAQETTENAADRSTEKTSEEKDAEEEPSPIGPRVRVNENGELVLDEQSLIVKRKKAKGAVTTVYEDEKSISSFTTYASFKKNGRAPEKKSRWTDSETVKFYTALTIIGTDFTLMADLFFRNRRTRLDLKNKFKNEEKYHKVLIDNALKGSDLSSLNNLELLAELDDDEDAERGDQEIDEFAISPGTAPTIAATGD